MYALRHVNPLAQALGWEPQTSPSPPVNLTEIGHFGGMHGGGLVEQETIATASTKEDLTAAWNVTGNGRAGQAISTTPASSRHVASHERRA